MNKLISAMVTAAMVVVALAAFTTSSSAQGDPGCGCIADTKLYGTDFNGSIYFEQKGFMSPKVMTQTFVNVPPGIKDARIYTGVWQGSPGKGGFFNITIQNSSGSYTTDTYRACDPCPQATKCSVDGYQCGRCDALSNVTSGNWNHNQNFDLVNIHDYIVGCGVQFISFNATPYITPGQNTITVKTEACDACARGGWDGRIYLIALLVVYENETMPEITYWVNEGALYLEKGSDCDGPYDHLYASKYFNNSYVTPKKVKLWSLGWPHVINATNPAPQPGDPNTTLNGNNIGYPDITESHGTAGYNEVMLRWNNIDTTFVTGNSQFLEYYDDNPLYERAFVEAFIIRGPSDKPDLVVTDIEFPSTMRPGKTDTIYATVENDGDPDQPNSDAGPFHVRLYVDDNPVSTFHVSGGLDAGDSTTASFSVSIAEESCPEFRVVADCNGVITEDNEFNNEMREKYQVGYVIVVNSNSDFASLAADGWLPAGSVVSAGGIYYIQNLDITNCAGNGISIANTDQRFVIRNCIVHHCEANGIHFDNVTGTPGSEVEVYENEVNNNDQKGIKVVNSSYAVIDSNHAHENQDYGVDVYMAHMPILDSHHITISNNTLEDNGYGIELMGFNCDVKCNTILDSIAHGGGEEGFGIYVSGNESTIHNNTIKGSDRYGIMLDSTTIPTYYNRIYGNDLIGNMKLDPSRPQAFDNGTNYWNTPTEVNYYYDNDDIHFNYTGNYWSDYDGNLHAGNYDSNGDGIGDTPYTIDGGTGAADFYPRIVTWWMCGDVNGDGKVAPSIDGRRIYTNSIITSKWAADVNCDGKVAPSIDGRRIYTNNLDCCKCTPCGSC